MQPITKLNIFGQEFADGTKFEIVHNLPVEKFERLFYLWYNSSAEFSQASLIDYVKRNSLGRICVSKADYDKITKGKAIPATKEEYEAQKKNKPKGV